MAIDEIKNDNTVRSGQGDGKLATLTRWKRNRRSENYLPGEINRASQVRKEKK